jgi:WD40 repeat protein
MIVLQGDAERIDHLQFSPNGRTLAAPCSRGLQVWHDLSPAPKIIGSPPIGPFLFTPDGGRVLVGGTRAVVLDLATGKVLCNLPTGSQSFTSSPDGQYLLTGRSSRRLDYRPLARLSEPIWSLGGIASSLWPPMFLGDGKRFIVSDCVCRRLVWKRTPISVTYVHQTREAATGKVIARLSRPMDQWFQHPAFSSHRKLIAARRGSTIAVFRVDNLKALPTRIRNENRRGFTGLAFHPSGRYLAATSNDNTVKFYDTADWKVSHAFNWDIGRLRAVAFSGDGMLAAVGGDKGKIVVQDVDL